MTKHRHHRTQRVVVSSTKRNHCVLFFPHLPVLFFLFVFSSSSSSSPPLPRPRPLSPPRPLLVLALLPLAIVGSTKRNRSCLFPHLLACPLLVFLSHLRVSVSSS